MGEHVGYVGGRRRVPPLLDWGTPFEEQKAAREWFDTRPDLQVVAFEEGSRPAFERKLNEVVGWCVQRRIYTECY
jgi:hypothetical protein